MALPPKINIEFANVSLATLNLEDDYNDNKLTHRHKYSSYNKSILVSKPHGFHENDDSKCSSNLSERSDDDHSCCKRGCSNISYYIPILHPFGPFRCTWDLLVMIMLIYTCVEVPVTLAFNISLDPNHFSGIIALTIDILLLIDILITFRTAYFDKWDRLRLIIDECEIAKRYIIGWFFIDLFTSVPFEFVLGSNQFVKFIKIFRIFRFVRIIKILRLFKMIKYFDGFMSQFVIRELLIVLKFLKIFALMILFAHISACVWFFIGRITIEDNNYWSPNGSWVSLHFDTTNLKYIDEKIPTFTKYSYSWYWAVVTLFTTGYGDIVATPGNKLEQWTVSICILVGTCFFAYFIGTLTSLITEGDRIKSVEIQKLEEAQAFCDHKKLPRELSRAVLTHIRYHCGYNYVFDENELIQSLPPYLQNDIHTYLAQTILMQLDFFKSFKKNLQILGQISLKMKSISCNENYSLFQKGDRAKEIYIQRTGESIINYYDGTHKILKRGDVIGERSMISPKRKYTVQCITFSEFYVLSVQDIVSILQTEYPTTWTKRWRKMVKELKKSIQKNKKFIRSVNFNKYDRKTHQINTPLTPQEQLNEQHNNNNNISIPTTQLPHNGSTSKTGFNAWVTQPSTIKTNRLSTAGSPNKIKSVRLNAVGAVDTPVLNSTDVPITNNNNTNNNPFKLDNISRSEGRILTTTTPKKTNDIKGASSSALMDNIRPGLQRSGSHPPPNTNTKTHSNSTTNSKAYKKKNKARFGIFVRRNSVDRDAAIHSAARKRAATHEINSHQSHTHRTRSFYDIEGISSSCDSSDDSGDIVPHDYDDNNDNDDDDDYEISKTYTNHTYHQMDTIRNDTMGHNNDDIVSAVDNMDQIYKQFTKLDNNNNKRNPIITNNIKRPKVNINRGGRKGGKFGGKKRRGPMGGKKTQTVNINKNIKRTTSPNVKDFKKNIRKQRDIRVKDNFINDMNISANENKNKNNKLINKMKPVTPMSPVESNSSITYNVVDNMIINDIKINKFNNDLNEIKKNSNESETTTEIIYRKYSNEENELKNDKKHTNHVKFKDDIIIENNINDDENGTFVMIQDYNNDENDNMNHIDDTNGNNSDSTKL